LQKQQNSLIAGLRATNEQPVMRPNVQEDKAPLGVADKSAISTISGAVAGACPPTSDAFSPTFSSTENEEKDGSSSAMVQLPHPEPPLTGTGSSAAVAAVPAVQTSAARHVMAVGKRGYALNRSDSTGSSAGRKFLAPTSSDPQQRSTLSDKERLHISSQQRKKNSMTTLPHAGQLGQLAKQRGGGGGGGGGEASKSSSFFAQLNSEIGQFHYPTINAAAAAAALHGYGHGHGQHQQHHHHGGGGGALGSPSAMMSQMIGGSGKLLPFNNQANAVYEVHDWWQEQVLCPQTSDDEI